MTIELTGETRAFAAPVTLSKSVVRVELDINTTPSEQPLHPDQLPSIFEELWATADEISSKGDIP